MAKIIIPGFRKIEVSGSGQGGTSNYEDLTNKPSINAKPLVGNMNISDFITMDDSLDPDSINPVQNKAVYKSIDGLKVENTAQATQIEEITSTIVKVRTDLQNNGYSDIAGGKNLLNANWDSKIQNGITFTNNLDGTFTITGKHTSKNSSFTDSILIPLEIGKSYTLQGQWVALYKKNNKTLLYAIAGGENSYTFVAEEDAVNICLYVRYDVTEEIDVTSSYMFSLTEDSSTFESYYPSNKALFDMVNGLITQLSELTVRLSAIDGIVDQSMSNDTVNLEEDIIRD